MPAMITDIGQAFLYTIELWGFLGILLAALVVEAVVDKTKK